MERTIFARLERVVRTLAIAIGVTTTIAVPAGFGTVAAVSFSMKAASRSRGPMA